MAHSATYDNQIEDIGIMSNQAVKQLCLQEENFIHLLLQ